MTGPDKSRYESRTDVREAKLLQVSITQLYLREPARELEHPCTRDNSSSFDAKLQSLLCVPD